MCSGAVLLETAPLFYRFLRKDMYALHVIALTSCVVVLYSFPVLFIKQKRTAQTLNCTGSRSARLSTQKGILFYKRLFVGQHSSQDSLFIPYFKIYLIVKEMSSAN